MNYYIQIKRVKRPIFLLLILFIFSNFCLTNELSVNKGTLDSGPIKLMSYNIRVASPVGHDYSYTDLNGIAKVLNREKPDLVALQEVDSCTIRSGKDSRQAKDLAKMTGMYYHFAGAVHRSGGVQGVAVLSRFPILESESIKMPVPKGANGETRSMALVMVKIRGQKVVFCSMHIDHIADSTRAYQIGIVLKTLNKYKDYPIFWAGDFNMTSEDPVLQNILKKHGFILQSRRPFTFNSVKPSIKIDYILRNNKADNGFKVIDFYTGDERYASDHRPLVMEIRPKAN